VSAAAVILDPARPIDGLADSKKLSEKQRDRLAPIIRERALAWAVAYAESAKSINSTSCHFAGQGAPCRHWLQPHQVLVDGLYCPQTGIPSQAIVKGDSKIAAISAASIPAKTARDELMLNCTNSIRFTVSPITRAIPPPRIRCANMACPRCNAGVSNPCANFDPSAWGKRGFFRYSTQSPKKP
jgi:ribonuclease HII